MFFSSKTMSNLKIGTTNSEPNSESLEQLWHTVRTNPSDFIGWTLLLQYCEHMKNMDQLREAYNGFLSLYPYCYIYWKKFAKYELELSNESNAFDVLERAVNAFPISIDIWIFYIQLFIKFNTNEKQIIGLCERAVKLCGDDYNSSDLWSLYLNWLRSTHQDLSEVTSLYDRILRISTQKLSQHLESFSSFVADNNPICIVSKKEYNFHCIEYLKYKTNNNIKFSDNQIKSVEQFSSLTDESSEESVAKIMFIRKNIIKERERIFSITLKETEERKYFEASIKRPYFHVNPLDIQQLDNWMQYLNWEISNSFHNKVILLFERCLVSCALYEHMWVRYTNYLVNKRYEMMSSDNEFFENFDINAIRDVFRRATKIHLKKSFKIHNLWSLFEEREDNIDESINILDKFQKENPNLIEAIVSKINLFHRRGDLNAVNSLYKSSIDKFIDNRKLCSHLSIKYSRFLSKVVKNRELSLQVLNSALNRDSHNYAIYLTLIDFEYQKQDLNVTKIEQLFDDLIANSLSVSMKLAMTQRKLEFMQDFGFESEKIQKTINRIQNLMHGFESIKSKSENVKRFKNDINSS